MSIEYSKKHNYEYKKRKKAGVIVHDKTQNKLLIIQSRGNLWGFPKGSLKINETFVDCAIRELYEETGIMLEKHQINTQNSIQIKSSNMYFYINMKECNVNIQNHILDNDANGIGWININCIKQNKFNNLIKFNKHFTMCFEYFFC
jgi:ADP-ribose pyrophosphatase YjhB (NUDIX family)